LIARAAAVYIRSTSGSGLLKPWTITTRFGSGTFASAAAICLTARSESIGLSSGGRTGGTTTVSSTLLGAVLSMK
jgi:hypothetical protein